MSQQRVLIWISIAFFCFTFTVSGNERDNHSFIGLTTYYGFIIPHSEKIRGISSTNPRGLDLDIGFHLKGDNAWRYCFCYPRAGIMLSWIDFDNKEILGDALIITPYIEPFFSAEKRFSFSLKTGIGLAYLNNVYDPVTNPLNHFYSTSLSFLLLLNLNLNYMVSDNINLRLAANYNHISNGGNRQPNKGINFPTTGLGVDYFFSKPEFSVRTADDYISADKKLSAFRISAFFTSKEISDEDDKRYPVLGISPKFSYLLGRLSAVSSGLEFVSDASIKERISMEGLDNSDYRRFSAFIGHELLIGKFNFYQEFGVYLYSPYKAKDPVYQRYGLEFMILDSISTGVSLKSHRHVADFLDFRVTLIL